MKPPTRFVHAIGVLLAIALLPLGSRASTMFAVANLVTDDPTANPAPVTDSALVNPWGVSYSATSPFWVSDNGAGVATLYSVDPNTNATTKAGLTVTIPGAGNVTGQAFNGAATTQFNGDLFLFASEDGTISGWRNALGTTAEVLQTASLDSVYKGLALGTSSGDSYLYAANFKAGSIDVLKGDAGAPDLPGKFIEVGGGPDHGMDPGAKRAPYRCCAARAARRRAGGRRDAQQRAGGLELVDLQQARRAVRYQPRRLSRR